MTTNCVTQIISGGQVRWSDYARGDGGPPDAGENLIYILGGIRDRGDFAAFRESVSGLSLTTEDPFEASFRKVEYLPLLPVLATPDFSPMLSSDYADWAYVIDLDAGVFRTMAVTQGGLEEVCAYPLDALPDPQAYYEAAVGEDG